MGIKLTELIIVDIEATCWERGSKPREEPNEIIEIGLCIFNLKEWKAEKKDQIIVTPTQSTVSKYCTNLTGWTKKQLVDSGVLLGDACSKLTSVYNTRSRTWASWGNYDRLQFERECRWKAIPYPFSADHINLKTIFAIHQGITNSVGMSKALPMLGLKLEGRHHNGADDAWNIGRILESMGRV